MVKDKKELPKLDGRFRRLTLDFVTLRREGLDWMKMNVVRIMHKFNTRRPGLVMTLGLAFLVAVGCGGPQVKSLLEERLDPLARDAKVDVYVGKINPPYIEVAIIESSSNPFVDDGIKMQQIEQLKQKARKLGANTIQDVHILAKHIEGYTMDERVPFTAWQQGKYNLYFMRGMAVKVPDALPSDVQAARPKEGWVIERFAPPVRRQDAVTSGSTPGALYGDLTTSATTTAPAPAGGVAPAKK